MDFTITIDNEDYVSISGGTCDDCDLNVFHNHVLICPLVQDNDQRCTTDEHDFHWKKKQ